MTDSGRLDGRRRWAAHEYGALLAEQLRQAGMPEARVEVVVADVLDHCGATGEDPVASFGQPADYAAQWLAPIGPVRIVLRMALGALGGVGLLMAVQALLTGGEWTRDLRISVGDAGVGAVVAIVMGVLPWTVDLWTSRRAARRFGSGRGVPPTLVRVLVVAALAVGVFVLGSLLGDGSGRVLFSAPRWALGIGGAVLASLLLVVREPRAPSLPRPPGGPTGRWARRRAELARLRDEVFGPPDRQR